MKFISYSFKRSSTVSKLLVIFGLTVSLAGCQWGEEVESLIQPNPDEFVVLFSDTSAVKLSTFFTDSMMTGSTQRHLVGRFADPYLGKIQASAYFQNAPESGVTVPDLAVFDSLTLSMGYDSYSYGDTTVALNVSVHKVLKDLMEYSSIYNITKLPFEAAPIGKVKLTPRPRTNKSLKIRLSQALGEEIFQKAKDNQITSSTSWTNILQGLVVKNADTDDASIIGFRSDSTAIRLHYHTIDVEGLKRDSVNVKLRGVYNQIIPDRTGTLLAKAPTTHRIALPSEETGNKAFIQAGPGVMTRVDFPNLRSLKYYKYSVINRAFLRLTPFQLSVTDQLRAPAQIHVFICDKNNEFITDPSTGLPLPLYDLNSTNTASPRPVVGTYVNDLINNTQYYLFDVSYYVSNLMNSGLQDGTGLVLRSSAFTGSYNFPENNSEFSKSVDRLVIGDQSTGIKNVRLELFYTVADAK
jgi:hypothetical protein